MVFLFLLKNEKENVEGRRGRMTKNWFFRDGFTFSHPSHVKIWLRFTPKKVGWQIDCEFFLCDYNYKWFSIIVDVKRSAKIRFVVPSCVYTSNWAHEVMIMQDVYLCIVEVQQWCVCKVIDTCCVLCNYTIIISQSLILTDFLLQTRPIHVRE